MKEQAVDETLTELYQRLARNTALLLAHPETPANEARFIRAHTAQQLYTLANVTAEQFTKNVQLEPYLDVAERYGLTVADALNDADFPDGLWHTFSDLETEIARLLKPRRYAEDGPRLRGTVTEFARMRRAEDEEDAQALAQAA